MNTSTTASSPAIAPAATLGVVLALLSACTYGGITSFARLAYDAGANPPTLVLARFLLAAMGFTLACVLLARPLTLPRSAWGATALTGLAWFVGAAGYLGSVQYIPVGLAALIFYTFPIIVEVLMMISERRGPQRRQLAVLIAAFLGLCLALGPALGGLSAVGVTLAFLGACGAAGQFFCGRNIVRDHDVLTVLIYVNLGGGLLALLLLLGLGTFALPAIGAVWGWSGFAFASLAYLLAVFLMYGSIRHAGPARSAMMFNLEPLISIAVAAVLLGERLSPLQWLGAGLVLCALAVATRQPARG